MKEWLKAESVSDVAEFYNRKYKESGKDAFSGGRYDYFFETYESIFGRPRPTDKLLDCGSGHGSFFENVLSRYKFSSPHMTGIDVSEEALTIARKKFQNYEYEFDFSNLSMDKISFRFHDNVFDVITSWGSIEHSFNPLEAFSGMLKAVKPGGIVMLTVPIEFEGCLDPIANEPFNRNNERFMDYKEWIEYFSQVKKPIMTTKLIVEGDAFLVFRK